MGMAFTVVSLLGKLPTARSTLGKEPGGWVGVIACLYC